ncbi:MAG: tyrosine-type recombinase/integrase [Chloroflexi bacterium]|nr:tyrosine-type recombinase/integrase [Chloroflexota bacterium]
MTAELIPNPERRLIPTRRQPMDQNPAAVYLAGLSKGSRRTMLQSLNAIAGLLTGGQADCFSVEWGALRYQHTAAIREQLSGHYSSATANKMLCGLRGALKAAWRLGQMNAEDYQRAIDVKSVSGQTIPAGRELAAGEIGALMKACADDSTPAGARDAAIVALLYTAGLRRAEVISLDLANYNAGKGLLKVHGKRNKVRTAYLVNGAAAAMEDWLSVRGTAAGPLFQAINKGGRIVEGRMTSQAIYNLLQKRAAEAGITEPFSPHDFRRTFVGDLLEAGADIATVSKMAGHASVQTTARYDRRPEEAKIKAANLLHVPYTRKKLHP